MNWPLSSSTYAALLISACAPAHIEHAKANVDSRMSYVYYTGWERPAGMPKSQGNCTAFALAYWSELKGMGHNPPLPTTCRLPDGQGHAVLDYQGWRLDVREKMPIKQQQSDCI
jgi:predicted transglutaminase-like cysteine proteinase